MYGTRVLGAPGTGGIVSSISWSRTRTSGATEKSRIPLQVCAYPQAGKYSEMASQRGVVNREVLISAMHDTTSNPPIMRKLDRICTIEEFPILAIPSYFPSR